jgi:hypothetical protein
MLHISPAAAAADDDDFFFFLKMAPLHGVHFPKKCGFSP